MLFQLWVILLRWPFFHHANLHHPTTNGHIAPLRRRSSPFFVHLSSPASSLPSSHNAGRRWRCVGHINASGPVVCPPTTERTWHMTATLLRSGSTLIPIWLGLRTSGVGCSGLHWWVCGSKYRAGSGLTVWCLSACTCNVRAQWLLVRWAELLIYLSKQSTGWGWLRYVACLLCTWCIVYVWNDVHDCNFIYFTMIFGNYLHVVTHLQCRCCDLYRNLCFACVSFPCLLASASDYIFS